MGDVFIDAETGQRWRVGGTFAPLVPARNVAEATKRVAQMTDDEIRLFAQRDPDIFRDVARAALLAAKPSK